MKAERCGLTLGDAMFIPGKGVFCNILVEMAKMPTEEDETWPFTE